MSIEVRKAETLADYLLFAGLLREYSEWLGESCMRGMTEEIAEPQTVFGPPGVALLGFVDGNIAGSVGLKPLGTKHAELKRLYVRPEFRGCGMGRALLQRVKEEAETLGYSVILLDTLPARMPEATALYESFGFSARGPYAEAQECGSQAYELRL